MKNDSAIRGVCQLTWAQREEKGKGRGKKKGREMEKLKE
jgi:hypothetical protein